MDTREDFQALLDKYEIGYVITDLDWAKIKKAKLGKAEFEERLKFMARVREMNDDGLIDVERAEAEFESLRTSSATYAAAYERATQNHLS